MATVVFLVTLFVFLLIVISIGLYYSCILYKKDNDVSFIAFAVAFVAGSISLIVCIEIINRLD